MGVNANLLAVLGVLLLGLAIFVSIVWSNTRAARKHTESIFQQQRLVHDSPDAHRLSQAVHLLVPGVRLGFDYVIRQDNGNLPYIAEWNSPAPQPTPAQIERALGRVTAIDSTGYRAMRRSEYPSIEDQLDAAFKARHGDPSEQEELDRRIREIKEKYPRSDDAL
ncbi:MAG: hypothetical protein R3308_03470 [Thiohalobacterales bacterium]|nr:hypothetical protein [Thiohalobacterales bacterium]